MGNMLVENTNTTTPPQGTTTTTSPENTTTPNRDLTGHKLLLVTPKMPEGWLEHLHDRFPGLKIVHAALDPWSDRSPRPEPDLTDEEWKTVTAIFTGPQLPTPKQAPNLQLVQLQSAGANYVLNDSIFKDTKIPFCTANGVAGPPIAEWVICTYLAHQHRIPHYLENMKEGNWERATGAMTTDDAVSKRVGILGYGSIGRQVARLATAMGMEVYAYTNRAKPTPESRRDTSYHPPGLGDPEGVLPAKWFSGTKTEELNAFLSSGLDLLVIALPLTPQTRGLMGAEQFKLLAGKQTYVSNIGRGATVITEDLITALDEGWISGAALDVTDPEPLPKDHPLWLKENVIITPHVSGGTTAYLKRSLVILDSNLERLGDGRTDFLNLVSRKRGY